MKPDRIYRVRVELGREAVCWFEEAKPFYCHFGTYTLGGKDLAPDASGFREATPEEIAAFEAAEAEREARQKAEHKQEAALLRLCGLAHDDFVRFRHVHREGNTLHVCTRENGVDSISVGAIRNPNYRSRETDDGDSTYANYEFAIPDEAA